MGHDLPISRKLAVGFALTTVMTIGLGVFALLRLNGVNAELAEMASNDIPSVQHLGEVRAQLGEFRTFELAQLTMQWIKNLKLMPKLMLTFGVILLVMLLQGVVAYRGLHSLNNVTTELAGNRMESIRLAGEMRGMTSRR